MYSIHHRRVRGVLVVALHEEPASLVVQRRLGERHDEKTSDHLQDVADRPALRVPVPLERVDAHVALSRDIRVEYPGQEERPRRLLRELGPNADLHAVRAPLVRRLRRALDERLDVERVLLVAQQ
eukprot:8911515-Heterocapsa_arctica.AAC.1